MDSDRKERTEVDTLKQRFLAHPERHPGVEWETVEAALSQDAENRKALEWME